MTKKVTRFSWIARFLAVVRYELLWNIRKKKLYGVVAIALVLATIQLFLRVILSGVANQPLSADPEFAISTGTGIGTLGMFLFALVTVMNSISGEFESGTIVPLLTKPVSRTTVFLGKIFAAFVTLLGAYTVLLVYLAVGGWVIYGPQNNLHLLPFVLFGSILSTFVWATIFLAVGALSKSSIVTAVVGVGLWMGLFFVGGIFGLFSEQAWVLTYLPGSGRVGYIPGVGSAPPGTPYPGMGVSTGTDSIGPNMVTYILHPSAEAKFFIYEFVPGGVPGLLKPLYTEPLYLILVRSVAVTAVYILVFSFIAWYALKRAQVTE